MAKTSHDSETLFDGVTKVFLPKRASTKKFLPDVFELPGGHVDYGEDMVDGLVREVQEEFGMNISVGDPFFVFTYTNPIKKSHSIEVIYFAQFNDPIENITLSPEDHSEYKWVSEAELPTLYTSTKGEDDIEFTAIKRAFGLLAGDSVRV